tara:strand:+ start:267 stop:533 length:267 start_codon:yes stop_codon:yes gene_type:complete
MQNLDVNRGKLLPRREQFADDGTYNEMVRICDAYEERFKDLFNYMDRLCAPSYTTDDRDALTAVNGMMVYNTTTNKFQVYENGGWRDA